MTTPRVGVIMKHKSTERYLCVFQEASKLWGFPKGRLKPFESHKDGACRELWEETRVHVSHNILNFNDMIHIKRGKHHHYYFLLDVEDKPNVTVDMYEILDHKWMTIDELSREKTSFFTEQAIKRLTINETVNITSSISTINISSNDNTLINEQK